MEVDSSRGPGGVSRLPVVETARKVAGRKVVEGLECVDKAVAQHVQFRTEPMKLLEERRTMGLFGFFKNEPGTSVLNLLKATNVFVRRTTQK